MAKFVSRKGYMLFEVESVKDVVEIFCLGVRDINMEVEIPSDDKI